MLERHTLGNKIKSVANSNEVVTISSGTMSIILGYHTAESALNDDIGRAAFFGLGTLISAIYTAAGTKAEFHKLKAKSKPKETAGLQ